MFAMQRSVTVPRAYRLTKIIHFHHPFYSASSGSLLRAGRVKVARSNRSAPTVRFVSSCRFEYIYAYSCIDPNERQDRTAATVCASVGSYVLEERGTLTECARDYAKHVHVRKIQEFREIL